MVGSPIDSRGSPTYDQSRLMQAVTPYREEMSRMDANELLGLVSRWLHILSAIILVGGTLFMRLVTVPSFNAADEKLDEARLAMRSRWSRLVGITSGLLIVSGIYNLVVIMRADSAPEPTYHMMLTVKLLLALGIFFLAAILAGRTELAKRFQQQEVLWLNVIALLAILLVCIAGAMKNAPRKPKDVVPEQANTVGIEQPDAG